MKSIVLPLLFACCLFLAACPLRTQSPITSDKRVAAPDMIFGTWALLENDTASSVHYIVASDPSDRAKLLIQEVDEQGKQIGETSRDAVLSSVAGRHYISIYDKGENSEGPGYYHCAIGQSNGDMQLIPVADYILEPEASGDEVAAYLTEHSDEQDHLDQEDIQRYRKIE